MTDAVNLGVNQFGFEAKLTSYKSGRSDVDCTETKFLVFG